MPERPIILFPAPERANRNQRTPVFRRFSSPNASRQYTRLQPAFQTLQTAFEHKRLTIQESPVGINPEFALVLEVVGSVDNFYTAVQHCEGMEWIFDKESDSILPDDDFHEIENGNRTDASLNGKVYCIMSNKQAMDQLLALWQRYSNGEEGVFQRNFSGLRDVFTRIKNIRQWSAQDRIAETHVVEYWHEALEWGGITPVPFEIELFYRKDPEKRRVATQAVGTEIQNLGGRVLQDISISEISYHALLAELPRTAIEQLINEYTDVQLTQVDDIMFFRPTCQSVFISSTDTDELSGISAVATLPAKEPIVAVLDGMPIQNHALLQGRVIVDDPDDYGNGYESKFRIHGTAMASLAIYGDLSRGDSPITSPVYMRPILKPKDMGMGNIEERAPQDKLFVDVLHRAVKRIIEGENGEGPIAPTIKVVNLSIGDPVRQLATVMSPLARLIDYLSHKYRLLFIISAGNHPEIIDSLDSSFSALKSKSISQRNEVFWHAIKDNQRNLRVFSPAESLNSLAVGALYDDFSIATENERFVWAVDKGLPSPISAIGKGYRGVIAPDLFYFGGRKFVRGTIQDRPTWVYSNREPGCKVAAPYGGGAESGQAYSFGTSDAAAQLTHEAAKCHDVLSQVFYDETGLNVPDDFSAILLKAMLTHGASWDTVAEELHRITGSGKKQLSRWVGNGIPDIERVKQCTKERITLIGLGSLKKDQGDVFRLPLNIDFSTRLIKRRLTVTLAYFSPISADKQAYRTAQLWFDVDDGGRGLIPEGARQNSDWQAVRKGTLQHEIFVGERPIAWNNNELLIKVSCREDAGKLRSEQIPYCLFVSFEVAEGYDIDLYSAVKSAIRTPVTITG